MYVYYLNLNLIGTFVIIWNAVYCIYFDLNRVLLLKEEMLKKIMRLIIIGILPLLISGCESNHEITEKAVIIKASIEAESVDISSESSHVEETSVNLKRLGFIDLEGNIEVISLNVLDIDFNIERKNYYLISGEGYEGFIVSFALEDGFNSHKQLPNHTSIVDEEILDLPFGTVELITLDADNGSAASEDSATYHHYFAFFYTDANVYMIDFSRNNKLDHTKEILVEMLKSIRLSEVASYEKVPLKEEVVSRNQVDVNNDGKLDDVQMILKKGYYTNDEELWAGNGAKWVGDFIIQVNLDGNIVKTSINKLMFYNDDLFFYGPEFDLIFTDYNGDGMTDFVLSNYLSSNLSGFSMLTIKEDGTVENVNIYKQFDFIGNRESDNSVLLTVIDNKIVMNAYNNVEGKYYNDFYVWDTDINMYVHDLREESK